MLNEKTKQNKQIFIQNFAGIYHTFKLYLICLIN